MLFLQYNQFVMSQFVIYLELKPYIKEWLINSLGNPVTFPSHSNENAVIRTFIQRRPADAPVETNNDNSLTAVHIPDSKAKPAEYYNYLANSGKRAVIEAVEDLFLQNLWDELATLAHMNNGKGVNTHIAAWCEMHGISLDHVETVRQKYFRIRKAYTEKGIDLRNFLRKKSGQE